MIYKYLNNINSPEDVKKLNTDELKELAGEIREEIINVISKNGGHLAPSLGVVELTLALHKIFDAPTDKIIWDVGHQAYPHKLITGRREKFNTIRQYDGLSGFPKRSESEYDDFGVGHASTSIAAAMGIATARDLNKEKYKVVAVIGDGALTGGLAYEGLNQAGFLRKDIIIVLNDNKMSISENVGGVAHYLNKIVTTPLYTQFKTDTWELLDKLPSWISSAAKDSVRRLKEGLKNLAVPTMLFEELGLRYIGPLDGHNIELLTENFKYIKTLKEPVLVHILTDKGRGYNFAQAEPTKFHGIGAFSIDTGESVSKSNTYSDVFGETITELAKTDSRIVAITAAMPEGTGLNEFRKELPERFFDVGIAEEYALTFAAGIATKGYKPICAIYSTFLQRGLDQLIHDICLQNLPVIFAVDRAGIVGEDGPTHQGTFDLSYLHCIPNLVICSPKDENELRSMLYTAVNNNFPIVIRYPRSKITGVEKTELQNIPYGKAEVLKSGDKGTIFAIGSMVYMAMEAVKDLPVGLVNARFAKPLDKELFMQFKDTKIITIEENTLNSGFGSAVMEMFNEAGCSVNLLRLGLPDMFIEQGNRNFILEKYGLSAKGIREKIEKFILDG
ncbi:MAG: 1-deoxy-D-xylulose-5-phosphate synthase [bacterium]|nr:1-deoxy-D-xylulose-5-phosphate synthase [bacterium]